MKIKNLQTGKVIDKTVHAGDKFDVPELEQKTMQYLYDDGDFYSLWTQQPMTK